METSGCVHHTAYSVASGVNGAELAGPSVTRCSNLAPVLSLPNLPLAAQWDAFSIP